MLTARLSLGTLAVEVPAAARVFHRHQLDFCCGGKTSLVDACLARGIDPESVLDEIVAAAHDARDERIDQKSIPEIIAHILKRFHEPLRAEMPRLVHMAEKVEAAHADHAEMPKGLARHLRRMQDELEDHMGKEEMILFPMLGAGPNPMVTMPIQVMLQEHDDHGRNLKTMRRLANDYRVPADGCATWHALYSGLDLLERELMEHIHIENNVLFPKALGR